MTLETLSPPIAGARAAHIRALIGAARGIIAEHGVTTAALDAIAEELIALGLRRELFPAEHFPLPPNGSAIFRLAEDSDGRFALYLSAKPPGGPVPPHDHTTWAVIAGVQGAEHNVVYDRAPAAEPGDETLTPRFERTVTPGRAITLLPEDVHTIQVRGDAPGLHLHFYGLALDRLDRRVTFESIAGGASRHFGVPVEIRTPALPPAAVKGAIRDDAELALLDVREEGVFAAEGHLLFAVPAPLSRLELIIDALVPRRSTRIILADADGSLVHRAASRLVRLGYTDVSVLAGGTRAWAEAGYEVFTGTNVPSKAFGEVVEQEAGTPHLSAAEVEARRRAGEKLVVIDSRPLPEFQVMSIPGAVDCPGAELVLRARQAAPDPETLVVVNCAGRTRSIIGAQILINAGFPNRVAALENGTMGWEWAGLSLSHGETKHLPWPDSGSLGWAQQAAANLAHRAGVTRIDRATLDRFRSEADTRSLYILDVRTPEEYRAGHLPGSRSAPGGQLVQATDAYVGTLRSRIVLVDGEDVRAPVTASWLIQLGWPEVFVLDAGLSGALEIGAEPRSVPLLGELRPHWIAPPDLATLPGAIVFDIDNGRDFRTAHIPGAWFATRAALVAAAPEHASADARIVVTSRDGVLAAFGAAELAAAGHADVRVLLGGTEAWRAAGLPLESGARRVLSQGDTWLAPAQVAPEERDAEKRRYIAWELGLPAQIARDGDARFRVLRPQ